MSSVSSSLNALPDQVTDQVTGQVAGHAQRQAQQQAQSQAQGPQAQVPLDFAALGTSFVAQGPKQPPLLARYAENLLWLARYIERVETLARLLETTRTFGLDDRDGRNWRAILRINTDEQRFLARYSDITPEAVVRFYVLDLENPTSIMHCMAQVRENARSLRALISIEMWLQINVFNARLRALCDEDIAPQNLATLCALLKEGVQAFTGITEGTFYRDQSWSFYALGRHLERADQMTRLLDIKYAPMIAEGAGVHVEAAQWDALLRATSGYHAYRRVYPQGYAAADVAGFLLLDGAFPRSVALNLSQVDWHLGQLRTRFGLRGGRAAIERLDGLRGLLSSVRPAELLERGLPPFLDILQRELIQLHQDIAAGFFPPTT